MTTQPDQLALEIAHRRVAPRTPYAEAMADPAISKLITARARRHMRERQKMDLKRIQANDNED